MRIVFISDPTFEPWDWTNPDTQGIGGSETSHIEMAQRLARLGHEVYSVAPIPFDHERVDPAGVVWLPFSPEVIRRLGDWRNLPPRLGGSLDGVPILYVIYRAPRLVDLLAPGALAWLVCQDTDYTQKANELTIERAARFERIIALCETQADHLRRRLPGATRRVCISSNGIKLTAILETERMEISRKPHRLIYASSPDRGLEYLLSIFPRVRELVPDAELDVAYGFNNIEKLIAMPGAPSVVARNRERLLGLMQQPGIIHNGRLAQRELLRHWFEASVWCHPSNFTETSCITCMDAQACGVVPVTRPVWAIAENVEHGVFIDGDVRGAVVQARYVCEVVKLLLDDGRRERIRESMIGYARDRFRWDRFVSQWDAWASTDVLAVDRPGWNRPFVPAEGVTA